MNIGSQLTLGSLILVPIGLILGFLAIFVKSSQFALVVSASAIGLLAALFALVGFFMSPTDNVYANFFDNHPKIFGGLVKPQTLYPIIKVGGTELTYTGTDDPFDFGWANNSFRIWIEDGQLKVNSSISDSAGKIVALLHNNQLTVNANNALDFNWDSSAIEVIDQYNRVVLQVQLSGNIASLAGIFALSNGGAVAIAPASAAQAAQGAGMVMEIRPPGGTINTVIKPIFQYPGSTHLHQRVAQ